MKSIFTMISVVCLALTGGAVFGAAGGGDVTFSPKGGSPVTFSHEWHVNAQGLKCSACHNHTFQMSIGEDKINMSKITKGEFCGHCHNGERSFDAKDTANCKRCHK